MKQNFKFNPALGNQENPSALYRIQAGKRIVVDIIGPLQ